MVPYLSYGAAMAMLFSGELAPRGNPQHIVPVSPLTGRQPISKQTSDRKAELLCKSLARRSKALSAAPGEAGE